MKYVGYFLLLLLLIYFSLVKPYLLLKGVHVETKGLHWDIKKRSFVIDSFLIYIPKVHNSSIFVYIGSLNLNPQEVRVGEVSVIEVSKEISKEPFDYDFTNLVKLAERVNLRVGKVYVSINSLPYNESVTVFVKDAELKNAVLRSYGGAKAVYMEGSHYHELYVFLKEAHAKDGIFYIDQAHVLSSSYAFSLSAQWKGKKGYFNATGYIKGYEGKDLILPDLQVFASGNLNYVSINTNFTASAPYLLVKGRSLGKLFGSGVFTQTFKESKKLKGHFTAGETYVSFNYTMYPEKILQVRFTNFPLDNNMLKTQIPLSSNLSGFAVVYPNKKSLSLRGFSDDLFFIDRNFKGFHIDLSLDYNKQVGKVELSVSYPTRISIFGSFAGKDFDGNIQTYMFPYSYGSFSTYLNYAGSLRYVRGFFYSSGVGKLISPVYKSTPLGDLSFNLNLGGNDYRIEFFSKGLKGEGEGSIKDKSFTGTLSFNGYSVSYAGAFGEDIEGEMRIKALPSNLLITGHLQGSVRKEDLIAHVKVRFDLLKRDTWNGQFSVNFEDIKKGQLYIPSGDIKGYVEGNLLKAEYSFKYAKGTLKYYLVDGSLSSLGRLTFQKGDFSLMGNYHLAKRADNLVLGLTGQGTYKTYIFPVHLSFEKSQEELKGELKGFSLKIGLFNVSFSDSLLKGSEDRGILKLGGLSVRVNSEKIITFQSSEGQVDIKNRSVVIPNINIDGALRGVISLSYQKGELKVSSHGDIDLDRISGLVKSRLLAYAKGRLSYTFEKSTDSLLVKVFSQEDVELRSRFLALPLKGQMYATYDNKVGKGFAHFKGDGGDIKLTLFGDGKLLSVGFSTQQIPVLYRSENVRFNGFTRAEGNITTNYRSVNIKANVDIWGNLNIKKLESKEQDKPQAYKLITLDIKLSTPEPLKVHLPEGYLYTYAEGNLGGNLYEPDYHIKLNLMGGSLVYFNKEFNLREGSVLLSPKENSLNVTLLSPTPDYNIIIDIKGDINNPKAFVRSEPPRDTKEVLTSLILGGGVGEGLFSLSSALIARFPEFSKLLEGVRSAVGTDVKINISPTTSSTGEAAISTKVSKDITNRLNIEYQQSTIKDPKETYGSANLRITPNTSTGVRIYSNNAQEYKIRFRKKFDF
ncbi:translocation/assembly module TamB domain-containing protein [Hydrogenobacter hydrogenophilus]|uniref:Translocation and assembly module TamB n=1 Tax=Hydrogenobacter hydrogenophilus TaxID=35835 RepID=A0A285NRJ3_9AQUI|nr:translocation/assembly module TamB domain-containing protein [Hydrogenobacter hydrogenophilus]SNZ12142.1 translocation and assembly module TamB [Hydrogenobacter hydrogenophilus]